VTGRVVPPIVSVVYSAVDRPRAFLARAVKATSHRYGRLRAGAEGTACALAAAMTKRCAVTLTYQRRQPERTVLYRTIETHLPTFLAQTAGDAEPPGLPAFVTREFEAYLRCGILAHG
jgi:hypothetical protein